MENFKLIFKVKLSFSFLFYWILIMEIKRVEEHIVLNNDQAEPHTDQLHLNKNIKAYEKVFWLLYLFMKSKNCISFRDFKTNNNIVIFIIDKYI